MTHLKIEQNNSAIEQVSSAVITKLYELATSGELDLSSNLVGRLHTDTTYQIYIDGIRQNYSELYISADNYYKYFVDPYARLFWANTPIGDGTGVMLSEWNKLEGDFERNAGKYGYLGNANYFGSSSSAKDAVLLDVLSRIQDFPEVIDLPIAGEMQEWYCPVFTYMTNLKVVYCPRGCTNMKVNPDPDGNGHPELTTIDFSYANNYTSPSFLFGGPFPKLEKIILCPSIVIFPHGFCAGSLSPKTGLLIFAYATDLTDVTSGDYGVSTWCLDNLSNCTLWVLDSVYLDWQSHPQISPKIANGKITLKTFSLYTGTDLLLKWLPLTTT